MPKRAKTPPPGDDEPRYFTICQPFPLNANWELPVDQISCARWIAEIIGPQNIYALMHKPSARGMVLIEVDRNFKDTELLLGEHRWKEVLKKPTQEQEERYSQIFHSTYNSNREAQKDGWKRLHVRDKWFKDYTFHSGKEFCHPYPQTHWCPTPPEDRTDKPMCRPLPTAVKPPPAVPAPPVVGSSAWLEERATLDLNSNPTALRGAWTAHGRGRGCTPPAVTTRSASIANPASASASASSVNSTPAQVAKSASTNSSGVPPDALNPLKRDAGAWGKGQAPFPPMSTTSTPSATSDATASKKTAWGSPNPKVTSAVNTTASTTPATTSNAAPVNGAWGAPNPKVKSAAVTAPERNPNIKVTIKPANKPQPIPSSSIDITSTSSPPLPPLEASGSSESSSSSKFSWADDVASQMEEMEIARQDNVVIRNPPHAALVDDPLDELLGADSEDEYSLPPMIAVGIAAVPTYSKPADDNVENLWAGHDDDDEVEEEFVCSVHGANPRICKRGICKERSDYERKKLMKEKEQQRNKDKKSKSKSSNSRYRSNGPGNWRKKDSRSRSQSENRTLSTARNGSPSSVAPTEEEGGASGSVWD